MAAKLDRADIICGYPAKTIRVFLGYDRSGAFDGSDVLKPDVFWKIAGEHFRL
jgi:hypothetical protein